MRRVGPRSRTPMDRFLENAMPEPNTGCWLWLGWLTSGGYAGIFEGRWPGAETRAHRFAYREFVGPIPACKVLDHLCRNRACVNPAHLEPVTNEENIRRGVVGANNRDKTRCAHGHEYDEANTYVWRDRSRHCRECNRLRMAAAAARKAA